MIAVGFRGSSGTMCFVQASVGQLHSALRVLRSTVHIIGLGGLSLMGDVAWIRMGCLPTPSVVLLRFWTLPWCRARPTLMFGWWTFGRLG